MIDCKPVNSPTDVNTKLSNLTEEPNDDEEKVEALPWTRRSTYVPGRFHKTRHRSRSEFIELVQPSL